MFSRFFVTDADFIHLQMSFDGGTNWINVATFRSPGVLGPYVTNAVDIKKLQNRDEMKKANVLVEDKPTRLISLEDEE